MSSLEPCPFLASSLILESEGARKDHPVLTNQPFSPASHTEILRMISFLGRKSHCVRSTKCLETPPLIKSTSAAGQASLSHTCGDHCDCADHQPQTGMYPAREPASAEWGVLTSPPREGCPWLGP